MIKLILAALIALIVLAHQTVHTPVGTTDALTLFAAIFFSAATLATVIVVRLLLRELGLLRRQPAYAHGRHRRPR